MMQNKSAKNGFFITLEGIEGAGKSTHARFLQELLQRAGRNCLLTREPGSTPLGEQIREILLQQRDLQIHAASEMLLMFAARAQHLQQIIMPALAEKQIIICDRFTDSTYAYQGGGRGVPVAAIDKLVEVVHPDCWPDLTLLFDLSPETGLARAGAERSADRFETETLAFFHAARQVFLDRAAAEPERFHIIDAERDLETIQSELKQLFKERALC